MLHLKAGDLQLWDMCVFLHHLGLGLLPWVIWADGVSFSSLQRRWEHVNATIMFLSPAYILMLLDMCVIIYLQYESL